MKIVDPACGSGSFLVRAYKELENYWKQQYGTQETLKFDEGESFYSMKVEILKNNIFGVDLDPKAVEIAQLNLLLQISERKQRLPLLQNNIKVGNSLIDDPSTSDKAFKWEEEFPEILKEGGFDIVIGNPPYGAEYSENEKNYFSMIFGNDKSRNSASYFISKAIAIIKSNGLFGMIVPKQLTYISSWKKARTELLALNLLSSIDVSEAFEGVELEQVIIILRKSIKNKDVVEVGFTDNNVFNVRHSSLNHFSDERFPMWINKDNEKIFEKILMNTVPLKEIATVNWGAPVSKFLTTLPSADSIPCIRGRDIKEFVIKPKYFLNKDQIIKSYLVSGDKLLLQRIVSRYGQRLFGNYRNAKIVCAYDKNQYYADKTVTMIWNSKIDLKFLLGLFNSTPISWFAHRYLYNMSQLTMEFMYDYARNFPVIKNLDEKQISEVRKVTEDLIRISEQLQYFNKSITDREEEIEKKFQLRKNELDTIIYNIYNITESEQEIILKELSGKI